MRYVVIWFPNFPITKRPTLVRSIVVTTVQKRDRYFEVRTGFEPVPYDLYFIIGAYAIFIQWCCPTAASNQFRHLTMVVGTGFEPV